ncbi:glycoside hydrolase family 88 protein [Dysgonomonas sp. Marseille-P4677]|uniref:glycoside hydrolase family 88 protein n=1 Tax=Dysgonomonas sp. Marseille-P4677 TaxID=2364790 RepID=UPI001911C924|nr:glycoside hydrolase family 88 protein [Dysgonomonas sp. Marseille-P4677]MBK5721772.1 glycoside hydrolase family 88 protein [Dysgonomonas sp. Marseille-P4677]
MNNRFVILILLILSIVSVQGQIEESSNYLNSIKLEQRKKWPENRTINIVFHGHSVPSGYFNTPTVNSLHSYPYLTLKAIKNCYANAVINVITTAIGGENSEQGSVRFERKVLNHLPDVLFIDYALNDRNIGIQRSEEAWRSMIEKAIDKGIKVILMTPTPDLSEDITANETALQRYSNKIRELAKEYKLGLIDSYMAFKEKKKNGEDLKVYMSQSNHPNERGHEVVKDLILEYFFDDAEMRTYKKLQIKDNMKKVADWQLMNFETQVRKGSQWANSHAYWAWTNATMYVGMAEWAKLSEDEKYWNFLYNIGEKNKWKTGPSYYFADDICIIQPYQQLYAKYKEKKMLEPSVKILKEIIDNPKTSSLNYYAEGSHSRWCWCDALFMAPTSFARIGKETGDRSYFDFLDKEFWITYDSLYSKEEKLFFRDTRYKTMKEENGEKVFWARGNGWVIGALTIVIDNLPNNYPSKNKYIELYQDMMERIAGLQDQQGFWHPSMLDPITYSMPEMSASGFFTYGLMWGINKNYLDEEKYLPVVEKAWKALCTSIHEDGKLGYVQAIGADPRKVSYDDTEVYGVGAFLLAGTEMYNYFNQ